MASFLEMVNRTAKFDRKRFMNDIRIFENPKKRPRQQLIVPPTDNEDGYDSEALTIPESREEREKTQAMVGDIDSDGGDEVTLYETVEEPPKQVPKTKEQKRRIELEKANAFRHRKKIKVSGTDIPLPITEFKDLCSPSLFVPVHVRRNIRKLGWETPTPIQCQAIPILMKGRELLGSAPTGSGKTGAFAIPLLTLLKEPKEEGFRGLVLAPTNELANQIYHQLLKLCQTDESPETSKAGGSRTFRVFLLTRQNANKNAFGKKSSKKRDVLVSTPKKLVNLINYGLDLSNVQHVVLDEADRLFELGLAEQVDEILNACTHPKVQRSLFSATLGEGVEELARTVLRDPVRVVIGQRRGASLTIDQELVFVGHEEAKLYSLRTIINKGIKPPVLLFVQTKERAKQLHHELAYDQIRVGVITADHSQHERDEALLKFRSGEIWVLICTDLMARGMDFKNVNQVINYDFPSSGVTYVHRIGRTGRAGRVGKAVTFFTEDDKPLLRSIAIIVRQSGCNVPNWMLSLKKTRRSDLKQIKTKPPKRYDILGERKPEKKPKGERSGATESDDEANSPTTQIAPKKKKKKMRIWSKTRRDRWKRHKKQKLGGDPDTQQTEKDPKSNGHIKSKNSKLKYID